MADVPEDLKGPTKEAGDVNSSSHESRRDRYCMARQSLAGSSLPNLTCPDTWRDPDTNEVLREWSPDDHKPTGCFPASGGPACCPAFAGESRVTKGHLAASYTLLVLLKQLSFASLAGISSRHLGLTHLGWFQVIPFILWLSLHLGYLILVQPFIWKVPNAVELLAVLCELTGMMCCIALLIVPSLMGLFSVILALVIGIFAAGALFELLYSTPPIIRSCCHTARVKLMQGLGGPTQGGDMAPASMSYWAFHPMSSPPSSVRMIRIPSETSKQVLGNRSLHGSRAPSLTRSDSRKADPSNRPNLADSSTSTMAPALALREMTPLHVMAVSTPGKAAYFVNTQGALMPFHSNRLRAQGMPIRKAWSAGDLAGQAARMDNGATPEDRSAPLARAQSLGREAARRMDRMEPPGAPRVGDSTVRWGREARNPSPKGNMSKSVVRRISADSARYAPGPSSDIFSHPPGASAPMGWMGGPGPTIISARHVRAYGMVHAGRRKSLSSVNISPSPSCVSFGSLALTEATSSLTSAQSSNDAAGSRTNRLPFPSLPIEIPGSVSGSVDSGQGACLPAASHTSIDLSPSGISLASSHSGNSPGSGRWLLSPSGFPTDAERGGSEGAAGSVSRWWGGWAARMF
eukprot:jgi/Mesvir1/9861/Mv22399-RA.1